ncbi:ImmA/IrrE family metallo-endopeptidase [Tsuneonella amylolytica]|uniref:ImmA/IrrE family metallo-endopeptidase n=1 Tax=Tsuneonella amylolytica TaxID=2338327 RepID=UPI000EA98FE9
MSLDRLELDGLGSPTELARRIHQLCASASAKLRDRGSLSPAWHKAFGSIVLAPSRRPERRRLSIAHELGHFLIPTHMPTPGGGFHARSIICEPPTPESMTAG